MDEVEGDWVATAGDIVAGPENDKLWFEIYWFEESILMFGDIREGPLTIFDWYKCWDEVDNLDWLWCCGGGCMIGEFPGI